MAEEVKIEIISRETIKPSSPTPDHLKHYKLSLLDQLVRQSVYMSMLPADKSKRAAVTADKCVTRRYMFQASKIANLRAKAAGINGSQLQGKQPKRTEAITALIWRCAMIASRLNKGFSMHSLEAGMVELPDLVSKFRRGIEEFGKKEAKRLGGDDWMEEIFQSWKERKDISIREDTNLYTCTSLCGFGFYETDFGWGKPIWLSLDSGSFLNNFILLTSTRDGDGVEACVTLREEDMVLFELDPELLSFAYPSNPSSSLMSKIGGNHLSRL
ncbi:BAHD acyltransferase BIA1-like [Ziziphus jujuba]|uniref:BAHD acyltransferase BIA1-like n=1 Tax=Ziziphus jujuba TaxID=326968 RepID=A0ABM4A2Q8_ZIZJJ|nr:BAHD acyltransferase BIA1-like [Ziziphus jujuba]